MARIDVLFFGRMADIAGIRRTTRDAGSLFALRDAVFDEAVLSDAGVDTAAIRMSVNQIQVSADQPLHDGDEVAFFSVFSGG